MEEAFPGTESYHWAEDARAHFHFFNHSLTGWPAGLQAVGFRSIPSIPGMGKVSFSGAQKEIWKARCLQIATLELFLYFGCILGDNGSRGVT